LVDTFAALLGASTPSSTSFAQEQGGVSSFLKRRPDFLSKASATVQGFCKLASDLRISIWPDHPMLGR
jgi:hypothetical protein